ncbi:MAG: hypothetical protein ACUVUG_07245, partial [Candidatus Aminicenantia bacterium]
MENFLKYRFSGLSKIEDSLTYSLFKGFDTLYKKNSIIKLLYPVATKEINLLTKLAHLSHRNIITPYDIVPLSGDYHCIIFHEYPRTTLYKKNLKEEDPISFNAQVLGALEFLMFNSILIKNVEWQNIFNIGGSIFLSEFEEKIIKTPCFENKYISFDKLLPSSLNLYLKDKKDVLPRIKEKNPSLLSSFLGFNSQRKEDQIIDGFAEDESISSPMLFGIFGGEGHGKSVFLKNFIVRNRSLSSPMIFLNSSDLKDFLNSFAGQLSW